MGGIQTLQDPPPALELLLGSSGLGHVCALSPQTHQCLIINACRIHGWQHLRLPSCVSKQRGFWKTYPKQFTPPTVILVTATSY